MPLSQELAGIGASLLFLAALLGALSIARRLGAPPDVTRKAFLGGLGGLALGASFLFEQPGWAPAFFLAVAGLTYLSFRFELFAAIEDDGPSLGSVFLPLSVAALLALFDDGAQIALAGIAAAAFGDTTAALVGRRLGSRKYRTFGHPRTMEGTLALFLASSAAMALVLGLEGTLGWHQAVAFALITGTVAASVETISVYGTDNLSVPLASAATLWVLVSASG